MEINAGILILGNAYHPNNKKTYYAKLENNLILPLG